MDLPIFQMVRTTEGQMKELFQKKTKTRFIKDQFVYHLDNVNVQFNNKAALKSVTLTINPGEILFVTGKSGAGKTTLLNLLSGDINPTSGKIHGVKNSTRFASQVFQDLKLFENETCEQNIWDAYDSKIYKKLQEF
jgi:ABC-type Fe3+/spermidine/putrescine transport system ATPase subunit